MKSVNITITAQPAEVDSKAKALRAAGAKVDSVLSKIGVITAQVDEGDLASIHKIPGITVERGETIRINPPDSPLQ